MQQINFTDNLEQDGNTAMFFIIQEAKETILDFSQGIVKVLQICSELIEYQCRMTQYNTLNEKLSNSQLKKLIRGIKTGTQVWLVILLMQLIIHIMYFSSTTHVSRIRKTFTNDLSATI